MFNRHDQVKKIQQEQKEKYVFNSYKKILARLDENPQELSNIMWIQMKAFENSLYK